MIVDLLAGAGIVYGGMVVGRLTKRPKSPPKPICGCDHHLAMHDPKTGVCHDKVQHRLNGVQQQPTQCTCKQYVGPITPELMLSTFQPRPELES